MPNAENIRKIIKLIKSKDLSQFNMKNYAQIYVPETGEYETLPQFTMTGEDYPSDACTTAACIAGWANVQRAEDKDLGVNFDYDCRVDAAEYMGITDPWSLLLFAPNDSPWEWNRNSNSPWTQAGNLGLLPEGLNPYEAEAKHAIAILEAIADKRIVDFNSDDSVVDIDL